MAQQQFSRLNHWQEYEKLKQENPHRFWHLDVRQLDELASDGGFPGAHAHLPFFSMLAHLVPAPFSTGTDTSKADMKITKEMVKSLLPEDTKTHIVVNCAGGNRSAKTCAILSELGYVNVYNLEGGWKKFFSSAQAAAVEQGKVGKMDRMDRGVPFVKCVYDKPTGTCQYVVFCLETRHAVIIDPVLDFDNLSWTITYGNAGQLLDFVKLWDLKVKYILETHAHADHLTSSQYLKQHLSTSPPVGIGQLIPTVQATFEKILKAEGLKCDGSQFDHLFKDGEEFVLGNVKASAMHVPGHTPDHMCYHIGDAVMTGDSIFMPDSGTARCDFPAGSAHQLWESITKKLFSLPDSTRVFVGHDYQPNGRPLAFQTSIAEQKQTNIHVKQGTNEKDFIQMRTTRDSTLGNPRLLFQSLNVNIRAGHYEGNEGLEASGAEGRVIMKCPVVLSKDVHEKV